MWSRLPALTVSAATLLLATSCGLEGGVSRLRADAPPSASSSSTSPSARAVQAAPKPALAAPRLVSPAPPVPTVRADRLEADRPSPPRPVRLEVASVDIALPVVRMGVDDAGAMALPDTVREVGWYQFGPRPGDPSGTTVLAAHVDSVREGLGPFARLRDVDRGATVVLQNAAGRSLRYSITKVRTIAKRSVPLAEVFSRAGEPRLVLITCGGAYDQDTGYRDNVVVTAVPTA